MSLNLGALAAAVCGAVKRGVHTSEFAVALLGLAVPVIDQAVTGLTNHMQAPAAAGQTNAGAIASTIAAAVIASTYAGARAYVKGKTLGAAGHAAAAEAPTWASSPASSSPTSAAAVTAVTPAPARGPERYDFGPVDEATPAQLAAEAREAGASIDGSSSATTSTTSAPALELMPGSSDSASAIPYDAGDDPELVHIAELAAAAAIRAVLGARAGKSPAIAAA